MQNNLINPRFSISSKLGVYSKLYNDIYFDKLSGLKESDHVYLKTNSLTTKFKKKANFVIAELGFGTGLNFLLTWKLWKENRKSNSSLTYISFENAPLSKKEISRVYKKIKELDKYSNLILKKIPEIYQSTHRIYIKGDNVNLILIYDDINSLINFNLIVDTWFLDAFSPKKNPFAWTDKLFKQLYNFTNLDGSLSTFSVAGHVRRGFTRFCGLHRDGRHWHAGPYLAHRPHRLGRDARRLRALCGGLLYGGRGLATGESQQCQSRADHGGLSRGRYLCLAWSADDDWCFGLC